MFGRLERVLAGQWENHILPFFWQHGEDGKTLRTYMRVISEAGIRAVCVESRPHPDYCGPKWWEDMDVILDEAKKRGMKVWILDDSHFPTGFANGAMKDKDDSLMRQSITVQRVDCGGPAGEMRIDLTRYREAPPFVKTFIETHTLPDEGLRVFHDDRLVSIVLMKKDGAGRGDLIDLSGAIGGDTLTFEKPEGDWQLLLCHLSRNRGYHRDYINMMDRVSVRCLIDAVYEPHWAHYSALFGTVIAGFFSDEPEIGNSHMYEFGKKIGEMDDNCFSAELEQGLKELWGENYAANLPFIFDEAFDRDFQAKIRFEYMDLVTKLVRENFSFQLGDWCRAHGVEYIGHLIEDNHQHMRTGSSLGHFFRGLAGEDMAGIDDIGGQVLPGGEEIGPGDFMNPIRDGEFWHYTLGKLGGSMAALDPIKKGRLMCEIFGNYGWKEGLKLEKYLADHFLMKGVNYFVPHAFSPAPFPDQDCPPHFYAHGHNPEIKAFGTLMGYMNRVADLLTGGAWEVPAAILYTAESDWAGDAMYLQKVGIPLYDSQIDYHFVPADVFTGDPRSAAAKVGEQLEINGQTYPVFILPQAEYVPAKALEAAIAMKRAGGAVYAVGALPQATIEKGRGDALVAEASLIPVVSLEELAERIRKDVLIPVSAAPACRRLRTAVYRGEKRILYIVNEGAVPYEGTVRLAGAASYRVYDAWNNTLGPVHKGTGDGIEIPVCLEPLKSILAILDEEELPVSEGFSELSEQGGALKEIIGAGSDWSDGWCRRTLDHEGLAKLAAEGTDVRELDALRAAFGDPKQISLPDTLAEEQEKFSGKILYTKKLAVGEAKCAFLVIEDAYEDVEVFVNGKSLGIQVAKTFVFDLTGALVSGENEVEILCSTTLERMSVDIKSRWGLPGEGQKPVVPSGISGKVRLVLE